MGGGRVPRKKSGDGGRRRVSNYRPTPPPSPNGGRSEKTWTEFEKKAAKASVVWGEVEWVRGSEEGDKIAGGGEEGRGEGGRKMGARPLQRGRGKRKCNGLLGATGSGEEKKCRIPVFPPYI